MTLSRAETGFFATAGSVTGRDHRRAERDGQDGYALVETPSLVAAVVTDGCSSGRSSEVGARLGAAWLAALITDRMPSDTTRSRPHEDAAEITEALVERIAAAASGLSPSVLGDMFLFTFLAAVVTREVAFVFGVGDGIVAVDTATQVLDPGPDNAPIYAAYGALDVEHPARRTIAATLHWSGSPDDIDILAIATDGATPIFEAGTDSPLSIAAVGADIRYQRNPSLLRKRLVMLSDRGAFHDDAALAVIARRKS